MSEGEKCCQGKCKEPVTMREPSLDGEDLFWCDRHWRRHAKLPAARPEPYTGDTPCHRCGAEAEGKAWWVGGVHVRVCNLCHSELNRSPGRSAGRTPDVEKDNQLWGTA